MTVVTMKLTLRGRARKSGHAERDRLIYIHAPSKHAVSQIGGHAYTIYHDIYHYINLPLYHYD